MWVSERKCECVCVRASKCVSDCVRVSERDQEREREREKEAKIANKKGNGDKSFKISTEGEY